MPTACLNFCFCSFSALSAATASALRLSGLFTSRPIPHRLGFASDTAFLLRRTPALYGQTWHSKVQYLWDIQCATKFNRERLAPAQGLAGNEPGFELGIDLLVDEDEAQHGPAHAPLIAALLEEHHLEQRVQQPRQQVRPLLQVVCHHLHQTWGVRPA